MIPPQAKKVFSGVIYDVYQWDVEMYDGSVQTFEKLKRPGTVEILPITAEGNILIQHQYQPDSPEPFLCPAGGRLDPGEEPLEAAKRELLEETGYEAGTWELLHTVRPGGKIDWTMSVYIARNIRRIQDQHLDPGEKIQIREVDFDEFIRLVDSGEMRRVEHELQAMCIRAVYNKAHYEALKNKLFGG